MWSKKTPSFSNIYNSECRWAWLYQLTGNIVVEGVSKRKRTLRRIVFLWSLSLVNMNFKLDSLWIYLEAKSLSLSRHYKWVLRDQVSLLFEWLQQHHAHYIPINTELVEQVKHSCQTRNTSVTWSIPIVCASSFFVHRGCVITSVFLMYGRKCAQAS